jgi:hypothetical protein
VLKNVDRKKKGNFARGKNEHLSRGGERPLVTHLPTTNGLGLVGAGLLAGAHWPQFDRLQVAPHAFNFLIFLFFYSEEVWEWA